MLTFTTGSFFGGSWVTTLQAAFLFGGLGATLLLGGLLVGVLPRLGREVRRRVRADAAFVVTHPERDYLVIDNSSIIWLTHLVSATPMLQANLHKENLVFHFRNHTFRQVYVFQRFEVDPDSLEHARRERIEQPKLPWKP
jgi:hypothetical protein